MHSPRLLLAPLALLSAAALAACSATSPDTPPSSPPAAVPPVSSSASPVESVDGNSSSGKGLVRVEGYTDSIGSGSYNLRLSRRRADAVRSALEALLPAGTEIVASGHGEADPVAANAKPDGSDNPAGRAKNRRVTISFSR